MAGEKVNVIWGDARSTNWGTVSTSFLFNVVLMFKLLNIVAIVILASKIANFWPKKYNFVLMPVLSKYNKN